MPSPRRTLLVCLVLLFLFAGTAGYLGYAYTRVRREALIFKREVELADAEAQRLQQRLEAERVSLQRQRESLQETADLSLLRIARLTVTTPSGAPIVGLVVWNPSTQHGLLVVDGLPPPGKDAAYQVWAVDAGSGHAIGAGVFQPDAQGSARVDFSPVQPLVNAVEFRITRERAAGTGRPKGPLVASARL